MQNDIEYEELQNSHGFCARRGNVQIGEIDIAIVGGNRLIIEHTHIDDEYDGGDVCKNLVQCVVEFARRTGRKILCLCPRAQSVFNKYPEFDDVRLIQMVK
ncbi:MAG: N-acetyltransferase [Alphaproteobacteria bacterium]|nr:N-acetyltransferase [Alphaproteobacteria bacterium]